MSARGLFVCFIIEIVYTAHLATLSCYQYHSLNHATKVHIHQQKSRSKESVKRVKPVSCIVCHFINVNVNKITNQLPHNYKTLAEITEYQSMQ